MAHHQRQARLGEAISPGVSLVAEEMEETLMGFLPEMPPEAGEYHVEVRKESFYLAGEDVWPWADGEVPEAPRHSITMYPQAPDDKAIPHGTVEILIEDIPNIRACLDTVEHVLAEREVGQ